MVSDNTGKGRALDFLTNAKAASIVLGMKFTFSKHALEELERRGISAEQARQILASPDQVAPAGGGLKAYQSRVKVGPKYYLIRVIVNEALVVTVYRTSKILKYWSKP